MSSRMSKSTGDRVLQWAGGLGRKTRFCWFWGGQWAVTGTSKNGLKSPSSRHIQAEAPNDHTFRGFVIFGGSSEPTENGWTFPKESSPRYKARAGAHFCKALIGAGSVSFGALLGVSLGKFLSGEWVDRFCCSLYLSGSKK